MESVSNRLRNSLLWPLVMVMATVLCAPAAAQNQRYSYCDVLEGRRFDAATGLKPPWLFHGGLLYLDRKTADSRSLMESTVDPTEQLNAKDFDFDWTAGLDTSVTRRWWDNDGMQLRFVGVFDMDANALVPITPALLRLNASPPVFAPNVQSIAARYETDMISFEANYLHCVNDSVTALAGFRYLALDDDLVADLDANPQSFRYASSTRNDLFGAQLGILWGPRPCFRRSVLVSADAKIGIFGNDGTHRSFVDTGAATLTIRDSADNLSWVGELGINGELPLTHCLSFVAGYEMLWIDGVAIASDQMPRSDFFNGRGSSDSGTAILHGAVFALEFHR